MKPTTKALILGGLFGVAVSLLAPALMPTQAIAAGLGGSVQYKIAGDRMMSVSELEQEINRLASEGWRVKTGVGTTVIMEK